jgi:hypothetical protein
VESFAISPDGLVTAFVTSPARSMVEKPSSVWVMQTDGPSIERFDLPAKLAEPRIVFSSEGLIVTGLEGEDELPTGFLLAPNGQVSLIYQQTPAATPIASPVGSPIASPVTSPVASPASPSPQPVKTEG